MKKILAFILVGSLFQTAFAQTDQHVLIETTKGNILLKLYNETPLHRDNFIKLVNEGFYDSLLFHRVINSFMIQGGDPDSKNAQTGQELGNGDVGYSLPAEFNSHIYHKKGVLAAAREGDEVNPLQNSSACQFYIVQGKVFNDSLLELAAKRITKMKAYNKVVREPSNQSLFEELKRFQKMENEDSILAIRSKIEILHQIEIARTPPHQFTDEQIKTYKTIGGTPHLDGSYTIFGQVLEGLDVVDKIAMAPRDKNDRPLENIRMKIIKVQ